MGLMYVHPLAFEVLDEKKENIVAYVTMVNDSWFGLSVLDKEPYYVFEVQDEEFASYAWENGIEIDVNKLPDKIYKCFSAAYLVIAEFMAEEFNESNK